jgi:4-amino-4-deoxychorismate lyase
MYPLVESIKLKDGVIANLEYHQQRVDRSKNELFPGAGRILLADQISIPENCQSGTFKVRVLYGETLHRVEFEPYVLRRVESLKVVCHESIDYHLKFTDRAVLEQLFAQRENCDDIIIIKNGLLTDSFAGNLLFSDGKRWVTPSSPLLKGTKRQFLLDQGIITEKSIRTEDLSGFECAGIINAMIDFNEMPVIAAKKIFS